MTSFMALDGVNTCKRMRRGLSNLAGVLQCKGGKLEEAEDFKFVFVVYCAIKSKQISSSA